MRGRPLSTPKTPNAGQSSFLYPDLLNQLNPKHPLLKLAREIDWSLKEVRKLKQHTRFASHPKNHKRARHAVRRLKTIKSDRRLKRNFLKGFEGDQINLLMAAAAFNFKKWMREVISSNCIFKLS